MQNNISGTQAQRRELKGYHLSELSEKRTAKKGSKGEFVTATWHRFGFRPVTRNVWLGAKQRFSEADLRELVGDKNFDWSEILSVVSVPIQPRNVVIDGKQVMSSDGHPSIQTAATIIAFGDELDEQALLRGYGLRPRGWTKERILAEMNGIGVDKTSDDQGEELPLGTKEAPLAAPEEV